MTSQQEANFIKIRELNSDKVRLESENLQYQRQAEALQTELDTIREKRMSPPVYAVVVDSFLSAFLLSTLPFAQCRSTRHSAIWVATPSPPPSIFVFRQKTLNFGGSLPTSRERAQKLRNLKWIARTCSEKRPAFRHRFRWDGWCCCGHRLPPRQRGFR